MATRNCQLCMKSTCYQEADRVGLKCALDGTVLIPAYKSQPSDSYHREIMLRVENYSAKCDDFVSAV